jgi:hypothetical protein
VGNDSGEYEIIKELILGQKYNDNWVIKKAGFSTRLT